MGGDDAGHARCAALVVDDSRTTRRIISELLSGLGFEVEEAENGARALERLRASAEPVLLVVDWNMPEMNGLALVRALRSDARFARLRVLMVTSEVERERVAQALAAGADEYLMKPFTRETLLSKLALLGMGTDQP